ncbi:FAST kinase domain-containing protein 2, mitochondrial [Arapaima gigas]
MVACRQPELVKVKLLLSDALYLLDGNIHLCWICETAEMTTCEYGNRLVRWALLLCRNRSQWRPFGSRVMGGWSVQPNMWLHTRVPCCHGVRCSRMLSVIGDISVVRFYSQEDTGSCVQAASKNVEGSTGVWVSQSLEHKLPSQDSQIEHHLDAKAEPQVLFHNELQSCRSPVDVLDLCERYNMTSKQISYSLGRIWDTLKTIPEEQRSYQLQLVYEHPTFEKLCLRLLLDSPQMKHGNLVYSLLPLVRLGVSQRSRVVQTLLRAAQENLNDFDERSLSVLASTLEVMQRCQNVDALKNGLRLLTWKRVTTIKNVETLQSLMRCVGKDAPMKLKRRLEEKALSMADQFTLPNSQFMFITLAAMNFSSKPLLDICRNKMIENIQGIPFSRLMAVLKACKALQYRDHLMLSAIAEHLESTFDMWSHKQMVTFLLNFEDLSFCPTSLMDAKAEKLIGDCGSLTKRDLQSVLKVYSSLNHVPQRHEKEFLDCLTNVLESYLPKMTQLELLRSVYFLCILGHFPLAPLEKLLSEETLHELLSKDGAQRTGIEQMLHLVGLCLHVDCPPLLRSVTVPPGGVSGPPAHCVISLPLTRMEDCTATREEPCTPKQCHRLAVLTVSPSSFCVGSRHPRGMLALKLRHLKALGFSPVLVPQRELEHLSPEKRDELLRSLVLGVRDEVPSVFDGKEAQGQ